VSDNRLFLQLRTFFVLASFSTLGCMGTPSPLHPGLTGTVGVPHNGVLTESSELPKGGDGFQRFRPNSPVYFGLPRLVRAIERAANAVQEKLPGGAPLVVGDLSAETGGKIPRHNSHRTGRDVDFLFFVTTPSGIPRKNPGFFALGEDGLVRFPDGTYGVLDVERQWLFFRELLTDSEIDVQFLFMSRELEARVVQYALAKETDLALIWHAQTVMLQPGDSLPHADHVHLRIACQPEEAVSGCTGGGPHWPWLDPLPTLQTPLVQLLTDIRETDPFELPPLEIPSQGDDEPDSVPEARAAHDLATARHPRS
jgi:penicillin-insensitive murein endopeptidase